MMSSDKECKELDVIPQRTDKELDAPHSGRLEISGFTFEDLESNKKNRNEAAFKMKPPQDIVWKNVNFKVKDKSILTDVWGKVPSGKVAAIMGPSGAGKSSLLNVLAGRSANASGIQISGHISVAGREINPVNFRENIAYVMQDDSLLATATPRETLNFSAQLRLPGSTTQSEIKSIVENLITDLGLDKCADVMIGGALIKGISGGQRKRTSVGVELITDPSLLFLDEPTSGLDSYSAFNMVKLLKAVAQSNAAVLCTIHQPSSEVFLLFDLVIFMVDGLVFYQGPVEGITPYFSRFGYDCPSNYNPSDFVMHLSQTESMEVMEQKGLFNFKEKRLSVHSAIATEVVAYDEGFGVPIKSSWIKQLYWLSYRLEYELGQSKEYSCFIACFV
jgi:ABC-type multidrug transport system ATPase subunit